MRNLATQILHSTYRRHLGNILFNTFLFFSNYLNFVCYLLKEVKLHNITRSNFSGIIKEKKGINLLNIASLNDLDFLTNSIHETETEINDRLSTEIDEIDEFDDDEYNFDFIDLVQQNEMED
ncbi:hypothetical protein PFBG_03933 [Plasmodium falciparum 7G8]|uniref:Uncharacterized protein n=2 Tax=Plasmodium falciparum TaxID=5833 RepID=A0A024V555_PLAFA|nr:hypothetical protein PFFVO_03492 [Plasmodium falciparum Vietnam Oak-Knoll (FVO)]EUR68702.1 hypothetical protein PFBG_03933 [Plasmodium falciparum 7G8]